MIDLINVLGWSMAWIGGVLVTLLLLGTLTYWVYNKWLERILNWKDKDSRKQIIYYIRHKKEIKEYIDMHNLVFEK